MEVPARSWREVSAERLQWIDGRKRACASAWWDTRHPQFPLINFSPAGSVERIMAGRHAEFTRKVWPNEAGRAWAEL